jgi:hypothetical protein
MAVEQPHLDDLRLEIGGGACRRLRTGLKRRAQPVLGQGQDGRHQEVQQQQERDIDHAGEVQDDPLAAFR